MPLNLTQLRVALCFNYGNLFQICSISFLLSSFCNVLLRMKRSTNSVTSSALLASIICNFSFSCLPSFDQLVGSSGNRCFRPSLVDHSGYRLLISSQGCNNALIQLWIGHSSCQLSAQVSIDEWTRALAPAQASCILFVLHLRVSISRENRFSRALDIRKRHRTYAILREWTPLRHAHKSSLIVLRQLERMIIQVHFTSNQRHLIEPKF